MMADRSWTLNHPSKRACTGPLTRSEVACVTGMVITVEPMLNLGTASVRVLNDQWTVESADGSLSAQWEHMVLVTINGYEVLTLRPGEDQQLRVFDGGGGG